MLQTAHFDSFETSHKIKIKHSQSPSLNVMSSRCASPWLIWRTMCDLSQRTLNCSLRDCLYCEKVCYKRVEILLRELAAWKLSLSPACPKDSLSGLHCLECDCSPSFPFAPSLLRCHNGGRPGLDGGEMGVIKSDPQGAMRGWHMYGIAVSLWNSGPRCCRRMLLRWRNAAGDTHNYMTSSTLTGWHPPTAAMFLCVCVGIRACICVRISAGERVKKTQ